MARPGYRHLRLERRGPVALVTLDRPDRLNALEPVLKEEIPRALREATGDPDVRVVVLTGAGRAFCAGADIAYLRELAERRDVEALGELVAAGGEIAALIRGARQPVIAAVNGAAAGGGANLALACDLRIASATASIGQTFSRIGLMPDWGGTFFLPRLVGTSRALELMWTGRMVGAAEALELGLFDRVVPPESLEEETLAFAVSLAGGSPDAVARTKAAVYTASGGGLEEALGAELAGQRELFAGPDAEEGLRAFLEKRAPRFGRVPGAAAPGAAVPS